MTSKWLFALKLIILSVNMRKSIERLDWASYFCILNSSFAWNHQYAAFTHLFGHSLQHLFLGLSSHQQLFGHSSQQNFLGQSLQQEFFGHLSKQHSWDIRCSRNYLDIHCSSHYLGIHSRSNPKLNSTMTRVIVSFILFTSYSNVYWRFLFVFFLTKVLFFT